MKYVIFLGDGMADVPVPELGGKTPLEAARHPGMDRMAQYGAVGIVRTVPEGMSPGSDTANLSVFGYDPRVYYSGRSPLEAASSGIELDAADVTYRCNLVTLSDAPALEEADMVDYSAGEISSAEARELVEAVNARFGSDAVRLYPGVSYRQCLVLRRAETGARLTPPHDISGRSVRGRLPEGQNAPLLREMMEFSYRTFAEHPVNAARMRAGKRPANAVWFWGEGRRPARTPCRAVPESCRFRTASRNGKAASFRPSRTASLLPAGRTRPNGIAVPPGSVTSNRGNKRFYVFDLLFPTVCPRKHPVFPSTLSLYHTYFQNAIGLWKNIQLIADILLMYFR